MRLQVRVGVARVDDGGVLGKFSVSAREGPHSFAAASPAFSSLSLLLPEPPPRGELCLAPEGATYFSSALWSWCVSPREIGARLLVPHALPRA